MICDDGVFHYFPAILPSEFPPKMSCDAYGCHERIRSNEDVRLSVGCHHKCHTRCLYHVDRYLRLCPVCTALNDFRSKEVSSAPPPPEDKCGVPNDFGNIRVLEEVEEDQAIGQALATSATISIFFLSLQQLT
ncbi:hypothetical protein TorRG33x02_118020 [Trema orientale]|uniref:Uncharacterized protein n=1 Tax=Trema orientale TaxID=63057 RepID=A0A2P5F3X1_TREOI|nr:hypothetical protein TorRG33x02_118020 [Trema orientale]